MPIYEYKCEKCGDVFEVRQKFSDDPLTVHEKCGGPVHRLLSAPALQFKGSGWYITDYARGGSSKSESKSETKGGSNGSKSEPKSSSESTPAKSESKSDSSKT